MPKTGYGSDAFLRASRVAPRWHAVPGRGPRASWARLRAGSLALRRYRGRLPTTAIRLTASPAGRTIGEHFAIRDGRRWRYRGAQGVLPLPTDFAAYMRGRPRQAVRTNVGHAREAGLRVLSCAIDNWAPGSDDTRSGLIAPGPAERWFVVDAEGEIVADSIVSIDAEVALLQGLVSWAPNARWLLHTAIVERLCGECRVLVTNSEDAYLLGPGNVHFQRLLGYEIARLEVTGPAASAAASGSPSQPAGLSWPPTEMKCGIARPEVAVPASVLVPA